MLIIYMFSIKTVFKNATQSYRGSTCFQDITQYILETATKNMKHRDITQGQNQKKKQNLWILLTHSLNSRLKQGSQRENGNQFKNAIVSKAKTAQNMCEIFSLLFTIVHIVPRIPGKWKEVNKYWLNKQ